MNTAMCHSLSCLLSILAVAFFSGPSRGDDFAAEQVVKALQAQNVRVKYMIYW